MRRSPLRRLALPLPGKLEHVRSRYGLGMAFMDHQQPQPFFKPTEPLPVHARQLLPDQRIKVEGLTGFFPIRRKALQPMVLETRTAHGIL